MKNKENWIIVALVVIIILLLVALGFAIPYYFFADHFAFIAS